MNLAVDYGNTQIKVGIFEQTVLQAKHAFIAAEDFFHFLRTEKFDHAIISSVATATVQWLPELHATGKKIQVNHRTPLPIHIRYDTPSTLGADRIAIACGAIARAPHKDCLAIDMGTCITFDFVDSQAAYLGGSISPGIQMRYKAMHTFTSKLPLLRPDWSVGLVSSSTEGCIQGGVMHGVIAEVEGIIDRYVKEFPNIEIMMCGGDSLFFAEHIRPNIAIVPDLVLSGLNSILIYNIDL